MAGPKRVGSLGKAQDEVETAVCDGMSRFEQEYVGRCPREFQAHLIGTLLLIRLQGVLTTAEQRLAKTPPLDRGTCVSR
ncbi:Na-translocating system protein MpsC family protein [Bremerella sp.]|uniref:Na-translocating system protein MpsC family protein n=1 Tax=Bremerella sp. TaxID=2795602 RepID=UPI00391D122E